MYPATTRGKRNAAVRGGVANPRQRGCGAVACSGVRSASKTSENRYYYNENMQYKPAKQCANQMER